MTSSTKRLWTLPFVMCAVSLLGVGFTFYLLVPTMAGYAVDQFGANQNQAGIASSSFFFGALIARVFAGKAVMRFGMRAVVVGSLVWLFVSCAAYLLPVDLGALITLRVLHGIGFGFSATALASAALAGAPAHRRAEASGWFLTGLTLATGFAPFVALEFINSGAGQRAVFLLTVACAGLGVASVLVVARSIPGRPAAAPVAPAEAPVPPRRGRLRNLGLVDPKALPIGFVIGFCAFAYAIVLAYLNLHAAERGLSQAASFYFLVYAVVMMIARPIAGMVQDRHNDDVVAIPLLLVIVVGLVLTGIATSPVTLLLGAAFVGLGYGTMLSAGQAIAVEKVGHARTGLGVSSYFLVVDAFTGLGPVLLGGLVAPLGYQNTFLVAAALPLVSLALYVLVARRVQPAQI